MSKKDIVYRLRDRLEMVRIEYQWIVTGGKDPLCEEAADVIERLCQAVLDEREACVEVCDNLIRHGNVAEVQQRYNQAYEQCKDAIRARGEK